MQNARRPSRWGNFRSARKSPWETAGVDMYVSSARRRVGGTDYTRDWLSLAELVCNTRSVPDCYQGHNHSMTVAQLLRGLARGATDHVPENLAGQCDQSRALLRKSRNAVLWLGEVENPVDPGIP